MTIAARAALFSAATSGTAGDHTPAGPAQSQIGVAG